MKIILYSFCTLLCLMLLNCNGKENPEPQPQPGYSDIDIITGLDFFDDNGSPISRWKSPNHNPGEVKTYPNPNIGTVSLYSQQEIIRIWLVPAEFLIDSVIMDIPTLSQSLDYSISDLENINIKDIPIPTFNTNISLDFSDVATGFYKLFYQMDTEELFWQNLYIDPTSTNIPTFGFLDNLCD